MILTRASAMHRTAPARVTNAFSRKIANHCAMVALYFMWYNFGRVIRRSA
jgi:hypothetical protein